MGSLIPKNECPCILISTPPPLSCANGLNELTLCHCGVQSNPREYFTGPSRYPKLETKDGANVRFCDLTRRQTDPSVLHCTVCLLHSRTKSHERISPLSGHSDYIEHNLIISRNKSIFGTWHKFCICTIDRNGCQKYESKLQTDISLVSPDFNYTMQ